MRILLRLRRGTGSEHVEGVEFRRALSGLAAMQEPDTPAGRLLPVERYDRVGADRGGHVHTVADPGPSALAGSDTHDATS